MDTQRTEVYHPDYNLDGRDNLPSLPARPAVYGLFGVIDGQPVHCRHVGGVPNLQAAVREHFEREPRAGLKAFMQGPWIKMLLYAPLAEGCAEQELRAKAEEWERQYDPFCDEEGEYRSEPEGDLD